MFINPTVIAERVMVFSYSFGVRIWANVSVFIGSKEEHSDYLGGGTLYLALIARSFDTNNHCY